MSKDSDCRKCLFDNIYVTGSLSANYSPNDSPLCGRSCQDIYNLAINCSWSNNYCNEAGFGCDQNAQNCQNQAVAKSCDRYGKLSGAIGIPDGLCSGYGPWKSRLPMACIGEGPAVYVCDDANLEDCHNEDYSALIQSNFDRTGCLEFHSGASSTGCSIKDACVPNDPDMPEITNDSGNLTLQCCLDQITHLGPHKEPLCGKGYCSSQPTCGDKFADYVQKYGYDHNVQDFLTISDCNEARTKVANAVLDKYLTGTIDKNKNLKYILEACQKAPGACDTKLENACRDVTAEQLKLNENLREVCGCMLPTNMYQSAYPPVIKPRCTPYCLGALRKGDGFGGFLSCDTNNCVMDDITISIINSKSGNVNLSEVCGDNKGGKYNCYFSDIDVQAIDSILPKVNFSANCDDCLTYDPNNPQNIKPIEGCKLKRCTDLDCYNNSPQTPYCNVTTGDCVECLGDTNCEKGKCVDLKCTTGPPKPPPHPSNGGNGNGKSKGMSTKEKIIIGASIGAVVLVAIIAALVIHHMKKKEKRVLSMR